MKPLLSYSIRWTILGGCLSLGAPLGLWLMWHVFFPNAIYPTSIAYWYSGISTCVIFMGFGFAAGRFMERIDSLSLFDPLTQLHNRRYLESRLQEIQALAKRTQQPFSLILLDLDHFKKVNDAFGHVVGDQTLRAISQVLKDNSRSADIVARYGGEEFLLVGSNTPADEAIALAERLRKSIEQLPSEQLGYPGPQTVSLGVFCVEPENFHQSIEKLIHEADLGLYVAKNTGRNKAVLQNTASQEMPPSKTSAS